MVSTTKKLNNIVLSTEWHSFVCSIDNGIEPSELHPHVDRKSSANEDSNVVFCKEVFSEISKQNNFSNIWGNFAYRLMRICYTAEMLSLDSDKLSREDFKEDFIERVNAFYYWLLQDVSHGMLVDSEYPSLPKDDSDIPNNIKLLIAHDKLIWNKIVSIQEDFLEILKELNLPENSSTSHMLSEISDRISSLREKYSVLR